MRMTTTAKVDDNPPVSPLRPLQSGEEDIEAAAAVAALPLWWLWSISWMMMFPPPPPPPPPPPWLMEQEPIQVSFNRDGEGESRGG